MPDMPQLEYVIKGLQKKAVNGPTRPRLPITPTVLGAIKQVWLRDPDRFSTSMLWAACCLCFFGFLRSGEVVVPSDASFNAGVHLCFEDVAVDSHIEPSTLRVTLKASKTDPFRKGVVIVIGRGTQEICPISAVLDYMSRRGPAPGPLFVFGDGRCLTRPRFVAALRLALGAAGIDARLYSGHSFRIGAATTAAIRGIPDSLIKTMGRWQSSAYTLYVRTPTSVLQSVARRLL